MRLTALAAGLFACACIFIFSGNAHAQSITDEIVINSPDVLDIIKSPKKNEQHQNKKQHILRHTIIEGDSLNSIAKKYKTPWKRIYDKNHSIENPDILNVGDTIIIPGPSEKLAERPVTSIENLKANNKTSTVTTAKHKVIRQQSYTTKQSVSPPPKKVYRGSSAGNTYYYGYCTYYAKMRRPDLPNSLGSAITWASRARAQGIPTGSSPRVGAIGQQGNHVVYVERVNKNGTVKVSEMNYAGFGVISSRTVPASYFTYIY